MNILCLHPKALPILSSLSIFAMKIWTYEKSLKYLIPAYVCIHMALSIGISRKMGIIENLPGFYKKHRMKLCRNLGNYLKSHSKAMKI